MAPKLIVTRGECGKFQCLEEGAVGCCIVGYGTSVNEAVGNWCIYSQTIEMRCDPPELLDCWTRVFKTKRLKMVEYTPCPRRD